MKLQPVFFFLFFLLSSFTAVAQTPVEMIIAMNKAYAVNSYSMNVEMKFFIGSNDVTPANTFTGEACKNGDSYYSSIMGKTTVCNKNCTVFIDDGQKLIVYSKNDHVKKKEKEPIEIPDTSAFGASANYSFGKGSATVVRIVIIPVDKTVYKKIELVINKQNSTLEEVSYYYTVEEDPASAVQKITVRYSAITLGAAVPDSKFSESRFVVRQKGTYVGAGKYAAYQVVEQDNTIPEKLR